MAFWDGEPSVARSYEFFQKQLETQIFMTAHNSNYICTYTPATFDSTLLASPVAVLFPCLYVQESYEPFDDWT